VVIIVLLSTWSVSKKWAVGRRTPLAACRYRRRALLTNKNHATWIDGGEISGKIKSKILIFFIKMKQEEIPDGVKRNDLRGEESRL
jgi:hypothetical protein